MIGVRIGTDCNSTFSNPAASIGSDPASPHDCDPELSRRNRPITDLTGLGLDSPPVHVHVVCVMCYVICGWIEMSNQSYEVHLIKWTHVYVLDVVVCVCVGGNAFWSKGNASG